MKKSLVRPRDSHKGDFGHALIIAGSKNMVGAAQLSALSALRCGAGKVTLASPEPVYSILAPALPEVMHIPLRAAENEMGIAPASIDEVLKFTSGMQAVAAGPGLGRHCSILTLVRRLIEEVRVPRVLDADALNVLEGHAAFLERSQAPLVLTPHEGELQRLFPEQLKTFEKDREAVAKAISKKYHCTLIRKGHRTCVADPDGDAYVNATGNAGMATAGAGDVLTGMIAAFLAQGFDVRLAARLGAFLHGKAGDMAAEQKGMTALIASDIIEFIPAALKTVENESDLSRLF